MKKLLFLVFLLSVSFAFSISAQELYKKWEKRFPGDSLKSAAFSPDDRYFIAGGPSKIYKLNTEDASIVWSIPFGGTKVVYSNTGDKFYACYGLEFRIHDAQTGAVLGSYLKDILSKDTLLTKIMDFVLSPDDSKAYIFASYIQKFNTPTTPDRYIVFDLQSKKILNDVQLSYITIDKVVISPDGKWFGMISNDGLDHSDPNSAYVDSLVYNTGIQVWKEYPSEKRETVTDVTFSSDSKYFVYCGEGGVARYVNLQTLKKEGYLDPPTDSPFLNALTFNENNQLLLGGGEDFAALSVWDFNKDKQMIGYYPNVGVYTSGGLLTTYVLPYLMNHSGYIFELWDLDSIVSVPETQPDINDLLVSPNPASDYIEINIERWSPSSGWTPSEIQIYNSLGECVMSDGAIHEPIDRRSQSSLQRIDISALPTGAYFLVLNNAKEVLTGSFIVLR